MTQSFYLRTLSGASVLLLTITNIFLTVRLLHTKNCSTSSLSSSSSFTLSAAASLSQNANIDNNNNNNSPIGVDSELIKIPNAPKLQSSRNCLNDYDIQQQQNFNSQDNDEQQMLNGDTKYETRLQIDFEIGRWDNQHLFKLYDFIVIGSRYVELSEKFSVCLATQSSIERLHSIVQVAEHWNGPISLAIYTAGDDEFFIFKIFIKYLRNCYQSIRENISIHLGVPKEKIPSSTRQFLTSKLYKKFHLYDNNNFIYNTNNCIQPPEVILRRLLKLRTPEMMKWRQKHPYPQNHLRNLARKGCQTSNVFLTDVDIIPSINFTENIDKFLKTQAQCNGSSSSSSGSGSSNIVGGGIGSRTSILGAASNRGAAARGLCAYVVPTYEIDFRVKFPANKSDLLRLVSKGLARPFHEKVFVYNQYATNFSRWQKEENSNADTHVSHNVTNFEFLYEPFYISTDNVPLHDERFLGYGFTRNSQVYEMYIAGYKFHVLSPIFTCHWGLQQKKTRPAWREQQNNVNRKHFERFKLEVLARYGKEQHTPSMIMNKINNKQQH